MNHPSFEQWLETGDGKEVLRRITHNLYRLDMRQWTATFEEDQDVHQKALIWLWQYWQRDPGFTWFYETAQDASHLARMLTIAAIRHSRCRWVKRFRDGVEIQQPEWDDYHNNLVSQHDPNDPPLSISHPADRPVEHLDCHLDIQAATEIVASQMHSLQANTPNWKNSAVPLEHIARTIIEAHLYHYQDRYQHPGNSGNLRRFCQSRRVTKNHLTTWRPIVFQALRHELQDYQH